MLSIVVLDVTSSLHSFWSKYLLNPQELLSVSCSVKYKRYSVKTAAGFTCTSSNCTSAFPCTSYVGTQKKYFMPTFPKLGAEAPLEHQLLTGAPQIFDISRETQPHLLDIRQKPTCDRRGEWHPI